MKESSTNKTTNHQDSNFRRFLANILISIISIVLITSVIELLLTFFHPIKQYGVAAGLLTPRETYEYGFTPNFTGFHNSVDFTSTIKINQLGLNDYNSITYDSDKKTILVVGDSAFEGYGLDKYDSVPKVLERNLAPDTTRVINASVRGWSTRQIPGFLSSEGYKFKPGYTLVVFTENDLWENQHQTGIYHGFPFKYPVSVKNKVVANIFLMARPSYLFRWLYYEMYLNKGQTDYASTNKKMMSAATNDSYWTDFEKKVISIRDQAEQMNTQLFFVLQPWLKSYQEEKNYQNSAGALAITDKAKSILSKNNIDYFDLTEDIKKAQMQNQLYFTYSDGHLNKAGSEIVGRALAKKFINELQNDPDQSHL